MTSDEFLECIIGEKAGSKISQPQAEVCYGLKVTDDDEIIHVFPPEANWIKAKEGARTFECDLVSLLCKVSYTPLPKYKMYRQLEEIKHQENTNRNSIPHRSNIRRSDFKEVELSKHALRKFQSTGTTTFRAIKAKDSAYIELIFPRGTNFTDIGNLAALFQGDIVLVKARANYEVMSLARLEKTYEQIRKG